MNDDEDEKIELMNKKMKNTSQFINHDKIIRNISFYDEKLANSIIYEQFEIFQNEEENQEKRLEALNIITEISSIRKDFPYKIFYELFVYYSPNFDRNLINDSIIKILDLNNSIANSFMQETSLIFDMINRFCNIMPDFPINIVKVLLNVSSLTVAVNVIVSPTSKSLSLANVVSITIEL